MRHRDKQNVSRIRRAFARVATGAVVVVAIGGCEGLFGAFLEDVYLETLEPAELSVEITNLPDDVERADVWVTEAETDEISLEGIDPEDEDAIEEAVEDWLDEQDVPEEIPEDPEDFVAGYGVADTDSDEYIDDGEISSTVSPEANFSGSDPPVIENADPDEIDGDIYVVNAAITRSDSEPEIGVWFAVVGAEGDGGESSAALDFENDDQFPSGE
ncbi:MAG: hypothetical protein ACLFM0_09530 [Spirochaetales bacterium]